MIRLPQFAPEFPRRSPRPPRINAWGPLWRLARRTGHTLIRSGEGVRIEPPA